MTNAKSSTPIRSTPKPAKRVVSAAGKPTRTSKPAPRTDSTANAKGKKTALEAAAAAAAAVAKQKNKLVRDSFTIPKAEYSVLEGLKLRAAMLKRPTKKSEILRAGISVLNAMTDKQFLAAVGSVPSLKTGRPKVETAETPPLE